MLEKTSHFGILLKLLNWSATRLKSILSWAALSYIA
uniref:Uncharacterized protein n=1 Tax=Arundo donax TaxID=35708 RepID=A0A0A9GV88_ARUDO